MANQDFDGIARLLLLRCPSLGPFLARDLVRNAFRDIMEMHQWSWLRARTQLSVPTADTTGTVNVTYGQDTATLVGHVVSADHIGRQFRLGVASPIVTITDSSTIGGTTLAFDQTWKGSTLTGQSYKIYQAYLTMPSDLLSITAVVDPAQNRPIATSGITLENLDRRDPQRSIAGTPAIALVPYDTYTGLPRFELWPHQYTQAYYPMSYIKKMIDPFDPGATVPYTLPANVILERALAYAAEWPGPNRNTPNPMFSHNTAKFHMDNFRAELGIAIKQDNELFNEVSWYQSDQSVPLGTMSASFMQAHDMSSLAGW